MTEQEFCTQDNLVSLVNQVADGTLDMFDLRGIAKEVELTDKVLYHLFNLAEQIGKVKIRQSVKKHTEDMLYWIRQG